jgi:hypothetical protein
VNIKELGSSPYKNGKVRCAASWRTEDYEMDGKHFRSLWHYSTLMVQCVWSWNNDRWEVFDTNVGWGSHSDLKGVNKYLDGLGVSDTLRLTSRKGRAFYYNPKIGYNLNIGKGD